MNRDVCQTSLDVLKERVSPLISGGQIAIGDFADIIWFPDIDRLPLQADSTTNTVFDCILTGNFIKRLLESDSWPQGQYRFWVLSKRTKDVLIAFGLLSDEDVEVIPRGSVFKYSDNWNKIDLEKKINFVFAGRISPTKNIESLIFSTYFLQKKFGVSCQLHLIGPTDNLPHPDRGVFNFHSYLDGVKEVSASLDWTTAPIFHPAVGVEEWLRIDLENKVIVNHSTFICEDFNVSLAQAQNQGWPSIVSSFGGNTDVMLSNSIAIPWNMIARSDESKIVQRVKSQIVASYIYEQLNRLAISEFDTEKASEQVTLSSPRVMLKERVDQCRKQLLAILGLSIDQVVPNDLTSLALTKSGASFFSYYRQVFGKIDFDNSVVIITNDLNEDTHPKRAMIKSSIMNWVEKFSGQKIFLISILQLNLPENIYVLTQTPKVCFPFSGEIYKTYLDFIKSIVSYNCEVYLKEYL